MKKKFFRSLLLALAVTGTGLVSSCKDYDEDCYNDMRLQEQSDYQAVLDKINECCNSMQTALDGKLDKSTFAEYMTILGLTGESKENLENAMQAAGVDDVVSFLINSYALAGQAADQASKNKNSIDEIYQLITGLTSDQFKEWSDSLRTAYETAADAYALATANELYLHNLDSITSAQSEVVDSTLAAQGSDIDSLFTLAAQLKQQSEDNLAAAKAYADSKDSLIYALLDSINQNVEGSTGIKLAINELKERVSAIENTLDKMITSVVIQGAVNPVYGSFSIPAGITSNMLIAYYGESDAAQDFDFPTVKTARLAYGDALTSKDMQMIGSIDKYQVLSQTVITGDNADNAGKLYITVNPNTADLSTAKFSLVNSLDSQVNVTISDLVPASEKLTFGWTRAGVGQVSANGLYEASVKVEPDQVEALKPQFDQEALKTVVKDAINYDNGVNLTNIAEVMFNEMSGILDAYAVKAVWTDTKEHSVYSNYSVAATAIQPLSYAFDVAGVTSKRLPTITPISEQELFSFDDIEEVSVTFTVNGIETPFTSRDIYYDVNQLFIEYNDTILSLNNVDDLIDEINNMVDDNIEIVRTKINDWVYSLQDDINETISELSGSLTDNINDLVEDALGDVNGTVNDYIDKANKWLKRFNKVINRINGAFDNLNEKLQVVAIYEGQDGEYHQLSNSQIFPSRFNGQGGINLKLTSYTAELVAPAMKKFVAVTNVFNGTASAQKGDAACKAALEAANSGDFGKVIDGNRNTVTFVPEAGYTYEIYYAGLDYSGKISARKFYVNVK